MAVSREQSSVIKMRYRLERDEDGYPPVSSEGLWVRSLPQGTVILDNIPFFAYGIAPGDELSVSRDASGDLWYKDLVKPNGGSVFRLHAPDQAGIERIRGELLDLGLPSEVDKASRLVALEVPRGADIRPLLEYLMDGQASERFDFEEAVLRHAVPE